MKLYWSPTSPYVRKVTVVAHETGLFSRLTLESVAVLPTKPNAEYGRENPLMKVPCLATDGGELLFDSRVICEYLDSLHDGRKLIPAGGGERWRVLRQQALADGILDAGILLRYEAAIRTDAQRNAEWIAGQSLKITQGLDALETETDTLSGPIDLGQITIACALGWLEFRNPVPDIRKGRAKLFAWYDTFVKRPSMQATIPKG